MKHTDEKQDRALIKKMVKKEDLTGKKGGGPVKKAEGGSLTARGMGAAKRGGGYNIS